MTKGNVCGQRPTLDRLRPATQVLVLRVNLTRIFHNNTELTATVFLEKLTKARSRPTRSERLLLLAPGCLEQNLSAGSALAARARAATEKVRALDTAINTVFPASTTSPVCRGQFAIFCCRFTVRNVTAKMQEALSGPLRVRVRSALFTNSRAGDVVRLPSFLLTTDSSRFRPHAAPAPC